MKPLVTILINNYNYQSYVAGAISSALTQTYEHCEVVVVDDGSTDSSRQIINSFGDRIRPVFKSNGGQASAFNAGFAHARGDIICFLDADDLFLPTKVEHMVRILETKPREWCFHHLQWTDKDLAPLQMPANLYKSGDRDFRSNVLGFTPPATSGLTFTRGLLEQMLPMPEAIKITSDNYLKFSSLALAAGYYIEEQLALQRIHGNNAYTGRTNMALEAEIQIETALGLRKQCPNLRRTWNRMYADGLAMRIRGQHQAGTVDYQRKNYFQGLSAVERVALCARITYKIAQQELRQRANAAA